MDDVRRLVVAYPRVFFACHTRHVRDSETGDLLSAHQASILDHLDNVELTGVLDLARHMGVTASTMSIAVDRLVRKGYVRRERDPNDGRRVNLRLTEAGVRIRSAKSVLDPQLVASLLSQLSSADRARALAGLELLAGAASSMMHGKQLFGLGRRDQSAPPETEGEGTPREEEDHELGADSHCGVDRADPADRRRRDNDPQGPRRDANGELRSDA